MSSNRGTVVPRAARSAVRRNADPRMIQPGESWCTRCEQPGQVLIDDRGLRMFHPRQGRSPLIACRLDETRLVDLVTVADLPMLAAFATASATAVCPRCRHQRDAHIADGVVTTILHGGELRCPCGCPGPGGVIIG